MQYANRVRLYGLTGGIASGKSTAATFFRQLGVPVIDADALAREVVAPGQPALGEIAQRWPAVVREGQLDRPALAAIVFRDASARAALDAITHPRIRAEAKRRAAELAAQGMPYALYEAALILEIDGDRELDGVVLVAASPEVQRARLSRRDGFSPNEIEQRLAAQLPLAEKRRRARWVLENDGAPEALRDAVRVLDRELRQEPPRGAT